MKISAGLREIDLSTVQDFEATFQPGGGPNYQPGAIFYDRG